MKFHYKCKNTKCYHDNVFKVEDIFITLKNELTFLIPKCEKCGTFRKHNAIFTINNQITKVVTD